MSQPSLKYEKQYEKGASLNWVGSGVGSSVGSGVSSGVNWAVGRGEGGAVGRGIWLGCRVGPGVVQTAASYAAAASTPLIWQTHKGQSNDPSL